MLNQQSFSSPPLFFGIPFFFRFTFSLPLILRTPYSSCVSVLLLVGYRILARFPFLAPSFTISLYLSQSYSSVFTDEMAVPVGAAVNVMLECTYSCSPLSIPYLLKSVSL